MGLNKNKIVNIILGFLIILSFFLSFALWTTGRNIGEEESVSDQSSSLQLSITSHALEDTFRPKLIALHGLTQEEPLLVATSNELRAFFNEDMSVSSLSQVERVDSFSAEAYTEKLQSGQWIEFVYTEGIPFGIISQKFIETTSDIETLFFDRVIVDVNRPDLIYFYHTDSQSFYSTRIYDDEKINLDPILENKALSYYPAESMLLNNQIRYLLLEPIEISYRTYVIQQLPKSSYISHFFTDTSLVDVRSNTESTRYIDLTKEVTINDTDHTLSYLSQVQTTSEMNPKERYTKSFERINQFENWADTFILSSYNEENQMLTFRREIEGVPVFSKNDHESISEVSIVEEGVTHLKIPLRFANTPINIKGAPKKVLISGVEMMQEVREQLGEEQFRKVEDFNIGYSWEESEEESEVIHFNPDWYIRYDGKWFTLSELLRLSKETAYGF